MTIFTSIFVSTYSAHITWTCEDSLVDQTCKSESMSYSHHLTICRKLRAVAGEAQPPCAYLIPAAVRQTNEADVNLNKVIITDAFTSDLLPFLLSISEFLLGQLSLIIHAYFDFDTETHSYSGPHSTKTKTEAEIILYGLEVVIPPFWPTHVIPSLFLIFSTSHGGWEQAPSPMLSLMRPASRVSHRHDERQADPQVQAKMSY